MSIWFWVGCAVLGLAVGRLRGGKFSALARLQLNGAIFIVAIAILDHYVIPRMIAGNPDWIGLGPVVNVLAYVPLAALIIWNRAVVWPWPLWIAGLLMNLTPILLNGGRMPSIRRNMFGPTADHVPFDENTRLPWLADWIPWLGNSYISPGDIVLGFAMMLAIQHAMRATAASAEPVFQDDPGQGASSDRSHEATQRPVA